MCYYPVADGKSMFVRFRRIGSIIVSYEDNLDLRSLDQNLAVKSSGSCVMCSSFPATVSGYGGSLYLWATCEEKEIVSSPVNKFDTAGRKVY